NYVVDLGLPVKFLNHNMGAFAPEEYGGYFAFGEIEDKGNYTSGNYTLNGVDPGCDIRLTQYDVSHVKLGHGFSLPTNAELSMLSDSCEWTWSSLGGHPGYKIKGKNDNYLFLPAAGYRNGQSNDELTTRGLYRSSRLFSEKLHYNWYMNFYSNSHSVVLSGNDIYLGESIRPVKSSGAQMTDGSVLQVMTDSAQWKSNQLSATMFATLYGYADAKTTSGVDAGFVVGNNRNITLDNGVKVASAISGDGKYSATYTMPKDTVYFYRAYVKMPNESVAYGDVLQWGRTYVDLGLPSGTKWANINVEAVAPWQDGDYYAYAETATKAAHTANTYKWYKNSTYLIPEDKWFDVQATRHDAASVNWGGVWMLPNQSDISELCANCTFTYGMQNNMTGYIVTSKINGNSIFITRSGYHRDSYNDYPTRLCNASSTIYCPDAYDAYYLENDHLQLYWWRTDGLTVRAVYKTNALSASGKDAFVRTLPAYKKFYNGSETDTLCAVVRGDDVLESGNTFGFVYWKTGTQNAVTVSATPAADGHFRAVISGLEPGVKYHYVAFINNGNKPYYGDTLNIDAVGMVDLGLSVKWANVNLGAECEGAGGDFYKWGATDKYKHTVDYNYSPKDLVPEEGYDVVYNNWGSQYRLPTKEEYLELINNTTREWIWRDGFRGFLFTSTMEGYTDKSIFIPAAGYYYDGRSYSHNNNADYWTSTVNGASNAYDINFANGAMVESGQGVPSHDKRHGFTIRGVQDKMAYIHTLNVSRKISDVAETDTLKGIVKVTGAGVQETGFFFGEDAALTVQNSTKHITQFTSNDTIKAVVSGIQKNKVYYYCAYAYDGTEYKLGDIKKLEAFSIIDLGLPSGTLWANVNIGGNTAEDYGDYLAWGEMEPKTSYTIDNYKYYQNSSYVNIGNDIAGTEYDVTTCKLGSIWTIPTRVQCEELLQNCVWEEITYNGIPCFKFISKINGNVIYFAKTELLDGTSHCYVGDGLYQASNLRDQTSEHCLYLRTGSPQASTANGELRWRGMTVRGVTTLNKMYGEEVTLSVLTAGCDWTIGASTATLSGKALMSSTTSRTIHRGFFIGNTTDINAENPSTGSFVEIQDADIAVDGSYSYNYPYDGSLKFFRACMQVDGTWYQGAVKSVSAADLLDAEFMADGTVINASFTNVYGYKNGSPSVAYDSALGRYVADFSSVNGYGSSTGHFYNFPYGSAYGFVNKLADGHTIEIMYSMPEFDNTTEMDAFASYEDGGSGVEIHNNHFVGEIYVDGYKMIDSNQHPEADKMHHVLVVWDKVNGKFSIYVDGSLKNSMDISGSFGNPTYSRYVLGGSTGGSSGAVSSFPGKIAFVRMYDDALTAEQVTYLYNSLNGH
ncbi:MAG: LamG domain-containing protein, partial [Prevotella sp.]|nr:LamG domain-containing protein [Prevotella sp.]